MNQQTYHFFSDPGHGWLQVPIRELHTLDIFDRISGFSYRNGNYAYLEEDDDASLFIRTKQERENIKVAFIRHDSPNQPSPVRSYAGFR